MIPAKKRVRIATRKSQLAMWQAHYVESMLNKHFPDTIVELVPMSTQGDRILDTPLAKIGGKGLFIKELEIAMQEGRADLAVHSMKDVPVEFPDGFGLHAICERENPFDAFVSNNVASFEDLPEGAVVGTSSLRRQAQLLALRPDLQIKNLRGNVNTRLAKLDNNEYDAIVLAAAGLLRLNMPERIKHLLSEQQCLPAVGQGAVGIECRNDDAELIAMLAKLSDPETTLRVTAERAMNKRLEGGCQVPIGSFATLQANASDSENQTLSMNALVASTDGKTMLRASGETICTLDDTERATALGIELAEQLLAQGARDLLDSLLLN